MKIHYRHRLVSPDLPTLESYLPLLHQIHANGWFSNFGPLVRQFESQLLDAYGLEHETCVTASNATSGLSAALLACERKGPVLLPAFTFPASLGAIRAAGRKPIVLDVDPESWIIMPETLDQALTGTNAAIVMLVAPFGMGCDFDAQIACCRKHGVPVVIDNAAGLGLQRREGTRGKDIFEVFSMHATKPFAIGEGGAIFAHRDYDAALRGALGFALTTADQPQGPAWGFNGKMSEFHAAIGLAQLNRISKLLEGRQKMANL